MRRGRRSIGLHVTLASYVFIASIRPVALDMTALASWLVVVALPRHAEQLIELYLSTAQHWCLIYHW